MRAFLVVFLFIGTILADSPPSVDKAKLKTIEDFLSSMSSLEADMTMEINLGNKDTAPKHYNGKIWLDRCKKLLRIDYGKNTMVAKDGSLIVQQENEPLQEFATDNTPAGILLRPSISFRNNGIFVKSLTQIKDLWQLSLSYDSPAGPIPVTLYFKPKPIMLLMGWTIQNPDGSITNVHLNPEEMHMEIAIKASIFTLD